MYACFDVVVIGAKLASYGSTELLFVAGVKTNGAPYSVGNRSYAIAVEQITLSDRVGFRLRAVVRARGDVVEIYR